MSSAHRATRSQDARDERGIIVTGWVKSDHKETKKQDTKKIRFNESEFLPPVDLLNAAADLPVPRLVAGNSNAPGICWSSFSSQNYHSAFVSSVGLGGLAQHLSLTARDDRIHSLSFLMSQLLILVSSTSDDCEGSKPFRGK